MPTWTRWFVGLQVGIPLAILVVRLATGHKVLYGLGWEMYSL